MKPAPFRYHAPATICEAVDMLDQVGASAKVLAGGLSLVPQLRMRQHVPAHLVDINGIKGRHIVRSTDGSMVVGLTVRQEELRQDLTASGRHPLLAEALGLSGTWLTRARGTVIGMLVNASADCELGAVATLHPMTITAIDGSGSRSVDTAALFSGQDQLTPTELAVSVAIPNFPASDGWAVLKVTSRALNPTVAGVAARLRVSQGTCIEAQVAPFGVGIWTGPLPGAAAALRDQPLTDQRIALVAEAVADLTSTADSPHASAAYRRHVLRVLTRRALRLARDRSASRRWIE